MGGEEPFILLVEDNPDDEALTLRSLRKANVGHRVEVARDGAEALAFLLREGPHTGRSSGAPAVVLLDLNLPKIAGLDVLRRLRADGRTRVQPVVVLTSSDEEKDLIESYGLGANGYVRKPVEIGRFLEAVGSLGLFWYLHNVAPRGGRVA